MPRYNHLVSIAFSVVSNHESGEDFTPALPKDALFARIYDLDRSTGGVEWLEAIGLPCDTFAVEADGAPGDSAAPRAADGP